MPFGNLTACHCCGRIFDHSDPGHVPYCPKCRAPSDSMAKLQIIDRDKAVLFNADGHEVESMPLSDKTLRVAVMKVRDWRKSHQFNLNSAIKQIEKRYEYRAP